jgi:hypothetical protein
MTKALAISQRQAQVLLRAAEAERGVVEIKIGNTFVRLIPSSRVSEIIETVDESPSPASFTNLDDYRRWRDRNRADRD